MKQAGPSFFKEIPVGENDSSDNSKIFKEDSSSDGSLPDLKIDDNNDELVPLPVYEISSDEELERSMVQMEKMVSIEPDSSDKIPWKHFQ